MASTSLAATWPPQDCRGLHGPLPLVESGHEETVLALFSPFGTNPGAKPLHLDAVRIDRSCIEVDLTYGEHQPALRLSPLVCNPQAELRSKSFAIEIQASPKALAGAMLLVAAVQENDNGAFWMETGKAGAAVPMSAYLPLLLLLGLLCSRTWVRIGVLAALVLAVFLVGQPPPDAPGLALLWIVALLALLWVVRCVLRLDRPLAIQAATVTVLALVFRLMADGLPANWYTNLPFPSQVPDPLVFAPTSGFNAWPAWLDRVHILDANTLLVMQRLLSSATCGLLVIALGMTRYAARDRSGPWARATPWIAGALLAVDPIQTLLGATDAAHIGLTFAFSLAAALLALAPSWGRAGPLFLVAATAIAAYSRPETLPILAALPLLADPGLLRQPLRSWPGAHGANALLLLAMLPAWWALIASLDHLEQSGTSALAWLTALSPEASGLIDSHGGPFAPTLLFVAAVLAGLFAAVQRRWRVPLLLAGCTVYFVFRYNTPHYCERALVDSIAWARHDILLHILVLVLAADGVAAGGEWLARRLPRPVPVAVVLGLAMVLFCGVRGLPLLERRQEFQAEYAFLREQLPRLGSQCATVVVADTSNHDGRLPDVGMVYPHPLLSRALPGHRFVVVAPTGRITNSVAAPCYRYFRGSQCALDSQLFAEWMSPETQQQLAQTCAQLDAASGSLIVEEKTLVGHVRTTPRQQSQMTLGLYELQMLPECGLHND